MLLDIGAGILIAIGLADWLHVPLTTLWIFLGVLFALGPDVDAIVNLIQYGGAGREYHHRDLLHLPLIFIPLGTAICFIFSPSLALLFALCSLSHFVHDSIGIGWGVQWLSPFITDHFSFFYLYQPEGKPALSRKLLYRFPHSEIDELDVEHGDPDWIHNIYVRMHPYSIFELMVFIIALIVLFLRV
jgi:hypothetical protein